MTAQSSNHLSQSVGAAVKRRQKSLLRNNSGNPNSIVVNLNVLYGCKEKWNELEVLTLQCRLRYEVKHVHNKGLNMH
jgi:hypothetical protein